MRQDRVMVTRQGFARETGRDLPAALRSIGLGCLLVLATLMGSWLTASSAHAARVASVSPSGEVAEVRQISLRFSEAVVAAGDPRLPAPVTLQCEGGNPAGDGRWASASQWLFDLREPLAAGRRCTLRAATGWAPLSGTWEGAREFSFSTGAPTVVQVQPYAGSIIEEDQHFLLRINGAVDLASVQRNAWCEAEGLGERIPLRLVQGAPRDALLRERRLTKNAASWLLVACERAFAADAGVRLVWGPGIAAAPPSSAVTRTARSFSWKVRPRFTAEFSCERERAGQPCMPLRPMLLRFSAPVPREQALAVRLQPAQGAALLPQPDAQDQRSMLDEVRFAVPLPENTTFTVSLPATLRDETGRALANAGSFPLTVSTAGMPPLAKFAAAPFGIVEAGEQAMLPLTLRHVQADLQGASTGGRVAIKRLDASASDEELLRWIARLETFHEGSLSARQAGLPKSQWMVTETETDARGRTRPVQRERQVATRELSLLQREAGVQRAELPQLQGSAPRATEVIGLPLPQGGYHVVEVESRVLGHALLSARAPMYVRTGALVTGMAVHFKRGRSSSLVWVTSLDRGRPVAGARVAVNDCRGKPLWSGSTDAAGLARIERGFDEPGGEDCLSSAGLFVTARKSQAASARPGADATAGDDLSFAFSEWHKGIEPWRFNLPTAGGTQAGRVAHTVFDRTLLRAGEGVSMKHFVRRETARGLALPAPDELPDSVVITHVGSGSELVQPLDWPSGARSALSRWDIPRSTLLGSYDVALQRGDQRMPSGSFRVEAFRVPLVDARLSGPRGTLVAPPQLVLNVQLNMLAGGPLARAPARLSALLREQPAQFPGYDEFSFQPPRADRATAGEDEEAPEDAGRLVADQLDAGTDAQGAATVTLPALPALRGASELLAELSFNDPNGEMQTVSQRLRLWPAAVVVGLRARSWAAARGEMNFSAVVLDTEGRPLKDREVEVIGRLRQTFSTRKRIVGGFYAYDNSSRLRELGTLCKGRSDAQGRLACSVKTEVVGEVELVAQARDDGQRLAQAATSLWVTGDGEQWFGQGNDDRIDILPEKRELQPGETARLQVRMPFREATALLTVEREGVIDSRVITLRGREPVIELPIPAAAEGSDGSVQGWAPNVYVSVLVLRGRVRDVPWTSFFRWGWREPVEWWRAWRFEGRDYRAPTAMVDLAKPSFRLGVTELRVGRDAHRLDVKVVPERSTYGVRETVRTTITVTHQGRPAAGAELAFAAVDEGLLALRGNDSWDLLERMLQPRPWGVVTATAQGEIIGRRHYGRKALPPGGDGGANPTRELFDTLLLWRGSVVLDAQGRAVVEVPLNDSLTSFRLVAVADAGADRFGSGSASVRVSQDLQVFSGLPPLARDGDRFDATLTLRNSTPRAMTVTARLGGQAQGEALAAAVPLAGSEQTVALAPGAAAELRWPVQVPEGAERIVWTGSAQEAGGAAADRLRLEQAVLPAVPLRVWQASLQPLGGTVSLPLAPPAGALATAGAPLGGVKVGLQRQLGGALPGLKRFFETYPYTCLEQRTSRAIALHDAAGWATLRDDLPGHLDSDGLASYFPPRPGDAARGSDRLTAYLLASAHESGVAWPEAAQERMLQGLAAFVEGRLVRTFNAPRPDLDVRKLAALEALSRHGRVRPQMLGSLALAPATWPTSALLDWWAVLRRVEALPQRAARLDEVQRLLRSRLAAGGTTLRFSTEASDDWWWLMDGPDANAARLLLAAVDSPAWKDDVPRLVTGHLARQRGGAWQTTTANLWSVLALERFSARFEAVPVTGRTELQWAGRTAFADWPAAAVDPETLRLPWAGDGAAAAASAPAAPSMLSATHLGAGRPWLSVQTLAAVPLKAPLVAGYRIDRTVTAVQRRQADVWSRGDLLRVRLEIEAASDMAWVVLSDPLPAGAALLGSGLGRDSALATRGERREGSSWLAFEERAGDVWRAYYEWLPRGRHVVEYTLRLNASGRFQLPPTRVEAMYAPDSFGERPNEAIEVAR